MNKEIIEIMSSGGDDRILLSERTGLNKYGCRPFPEIKIHFGSSTSNNISFEAFNNLRSALINFNRFEGTGKLSFYRSEFEKVRIGISQFFDLPANSEVILGPSGTDLELVVLANGLSSDEAKVLNVVINPDEAGSGSLNSSQGNHFADKTALNISVSKGAKIDGFNEGSVRCEFVYSRNANNLDWSDEELYTNLERLIEQGLTEQRRVIIHGICISKLGKIYPSYPVLERLRNKYNDQIDLIVDACQTRISPERLNAYLELNACVLITGSKFLGGPPFSGAMILPEAVSSRVINKLCFPEGIFDYFSLNEFPDSFRSSFEKKVNQEDRINLGLLFRWKAAILEMKKHSSIEISRSHFILKAFKEELIKVIDQSPLFNLLSDEREDESIQHPFDRRSIFPLLLNSKYSLDDSKILHKKLAEKIIDESVRPSYLSSVLETNINVGQPVSFFSEGDELSGNVRLSMNIQQISELAYLSEEEIRDILKQDILLFHMKSEYILNNHI